MAIYNHNDGCHMGGILDNSMKNGLQINLKDAIEDVGGNVPDSVCLWEYPEIIRKQLSTKTVNKINLYGKDVINISKSSENGEDVYNICTIYDTS